MLYAELQGKLGTGFRLATDRAEDLLTSTTFQLLRYVPIQRGFLALLRTARAFSGDWPDFQHPDDIEVVLWRRFPGAGCPDVLLKLHRDGGLIGVVLIEVKLYSPKSGVALDDESDEDTELDELASKHTNANKCQRCRIAERHRIANRVVTSPPTAPPAAGPRPC